MKPEINIQTTAFCKKLLIDDSLSLVLSNNRRKMDNNKYERLSWRSKPTPTDTLNVAKNIDTKQNSRKRAPLVLSKPKVDGENGENKDRNNILVKDEISALASDLNDIAIEKS